MLSCPIYFWLYLTLGVWNWTFNHSAVELNDLLGSWRCVCEYNFWLHTCHCRSGRLDRYWSSDNWCSCFEFIVIDNLHGLRLSIFNLNICFFVGLFIPTSTTAKQRFLLTLFLSCWSFVSFVYGHKFYYLDSNWCFNKVVYVTNHLLFSALFINNNRNKNISSQSYVSHSPAVLGNMCIQYALHYTK